MAENSILVKGARQHNLKNVDVVIPRDQLVVITGLSGSGKSSLAFDTIYAEGQRRYVESLSAYARQFLGQMDEQIVDAVLALAPGTRLMILAPLVQHRKGEHLGVFEDVRKAGYVRVRVDGEVHDVSTDFKLDKYKNHTIEVVVDRLMVPEPGTNGQLPADASRIADSVETA